jgi:hypothetical protein
VICGIKTVIFSYIVTESATAVELSHAGKNSIDDEVSPPSQVTNKSTASTVIEQTLAADKTAENIMLQPVLVKQSSLDLRKEESDINDDSLLSGIKLSAEHGKAQNSIVLYTV